MEMGLVGGIGLLVVAMAIWAVTWAAAEGKLKRNQWSGIRIPSTMESDEGWVAGHRAALGLSKALAMVSTLLGVALIVAGIWLRSDDSIPVIVLCIVGYTVVTVGSIAIAVVAGRAAAKANERH